jgi:hypothetical protein
MVKKTSAMAKTMSKINSGDLIYIPSEVTLYRVDPRAKAAVSDFVRLKKPKNLLVTRINEKTYEVYFEDKKWLVDKNKVYEV